MPADGGRDPGLAVRIACAAALVVLANVAFVSLVVWLASLLDELVVVLGVRPAGPLGTAVAAVGDPTNWRSPAVWPLTAAFLLAQYGYATRRPLGGAGLDAGDADRPAADAGDAGGPAGDVTAWEDRDLRGRLRRLATQVGVPTPDVVVADTPEANSYTVGRRGNATVVVTRPLLGALDDRELDAVLAHELAHVANRDVTVMTMATTPFRLSRRLALALDRFVYAIGVGLYLASMAGVAVLTATMAAFLVYRELVGLTTGSAPAGSLTAMTGAFPPIRLVTEGIPHVGAYVLLVALFALIPLTATGAYRVLLDPVPRLLARYREFAADRGSARVTGDPAALAGALETLDAVRPATDARRADPIAALCLHPGGVGAEPPVGPIRARIDEHLPRLDWLIDRLSGRLLAHPRTGERVARLRDLTD